MADPMNWCLNDAFHTDALEANAPIRDEGTSGYDASDYDDEES